MKAYALFLFQPFEYLAIQSFINHHRQVILHTIFANKRTVRETYEKQTQAMKKRITTNRGCHHHGAVKLGMATGKNK